ncbi:MAG: hypothetical protein AAF598_12105 [Bacteroidota bacterium]
MKTIQRIDIGLSIPVVLLMGFYVYISVEMWGPYILVGLIALSVIGLVIHSIRLHSTKAFFIFRFAGIGLFLYFIAFFDFMFEEDVSFWERVSEVLWYPPTWLLLVYSIWSMVKLVVLGRQHQVEPPSADVLDQAMD